MPVPTRYVLHQLPVLRGMGQALFHELGRRAGLVRPGAAGVPGPVLERRVPPLPERLVRDYVRHVGGDERAYRGRIPPHLFPQWSLPLVGPLTRGLRYPLLAAMNGGCRMRVNAPLPAGEPLELRGRLAGVDDDGRRAVIDLELVTGTRASPEALVAHLLLFVRLGPPDRTRPEPKPEKEKPRVPENAAELERWTIPRGAGLDFAKLTGDFNPVHWIPAWGRALGFPSAILHGFSTLARALEGLYRGRFGGDTFAIRELEARFTRPLVLPSQAGLYSAGDQFWVGDAPGGVAYLEGTCRARGNGKGDEE